MADVRWKSIESPDEVIEFPKVRARLVDIGDVTVGELNHERAGVGPGTSVPWSVANGARPGTWA